MLQLNIYIIFFILFYGLPFLSDKIYARGGKNLEMFRKFGHLVTEAGIPGCIAVFAISLYAWDGVLKATNSEAYGNFVQFEWLHMLCGLCFLAAVILAVFRSLRCMTEVGLIIFFGLPVMQFVINLILKVTYNFAVIIAFIMLVGMVVLYFCPVVLDLFLMGVNGISVLINSIFSIGSGELMIPFAVIVLAAFLFGTPYLFSFMGLHFTAMENTGVNLAILLILLVLYGLSAGLEQRRAIGIGYAGTSNVSVREGKKSGKLLLILIAVVAIALIFSGAMVLSKVGKLQILTKKYNVPESAVEWNGHYYMVFDDADSWPAAQNNCEKMGGNLAAITSQEEYDFVRSYLDENGYTSVFFGCYSGGYIYEPVWYWVTGENFDYTAWGSGEPNADNGGQEFYGSINTGGWNDCLITAGSSNLYLCEWESKKPEINDSDYLEYNGHYYAVYDGALSWGDAEAKAEETGGYLACITSEEENTEIRKFCRRKGALTVYFGIHTPEDCDTTSLQWVDGEPLEYTDWESDQPGNDGCEIGIIYSSGRWITEETYHTTRYVVEWDSAKEIKD